MFYVYVRFTIPSEKFSYYILLLLHGDEACPIKLPHHKEILIKLSQII